MLLKRQVTNIIDRLSEIAARSPAGARILTRMLVAQGMVCSRQVRAIEQVETLADVEFPIFSQWGEDGIIEWLVHHNGEMPESFIEFGVENYRESNTRFLLNSRNWRGLVVDGNPAYIAAIRSDDDSWRHDLASKAAFITAENINELIEEAHFGGEIGILSVDIDGNDYWVWKAIERVNPHIVIIEYNSVFGDRFPLTIPYDPAFVRTKSHYSNLYWGASIQAMSSLAAEKGYKLLGTNRAGTNAFFIRNDRLPLFAHRIGSCAPRPSRYREALDVAGNWTFARARARAGLISGCIVTDVSTGKSARLDSFGELYSERWAAMIDGK